MAKPSFEAAKGTRDWYGRETIIRNHIRDTLRGIFERYGYDRLETPMLETRSALGFKGGGEIQKEVFLVKDQGDRDLALRFDQTVPLARFVASYPEIKFPFKRYAMGEVFRDGPTQPEQGRYRIFTQCDVDILGVKEMSAEAELFALAQDAFKSLGLGDVDVNINNRKLLEGILDYAGVRPGVRLRTITALDKLDKIGVDGLREELETLGRAEVLLSNATMGSVLQDYGQSASLSPRTIEKIISEVGAERCAGIVGMLQLKPSRDNLVQMLDGSQNQRLLEKTSIDKILGIVQASGGNLELCNRLEQIVTSDRGKDGLREIRQLLDYSQSMGFDSVRLNPSLARGLDYYTGTTIEVFLKDRTIVPSAILAGGRFDNMVGDFRGGEEEVPAVGFSFGLERLAMILGERMAVPNTVRQLYIVPIGGTQGQCLKIAHDLRNQGVKVDMNLGGLKVKKAVEYADRSKIPYVGFVGEDELRDSSIMIKDLSTGQQTKVPIDKVGAHLSSTNIK